MNSNGINYKQKYQELKMKYMEAVDTAFRLGFEQGMVQAEQNQMMQQQQAQQEMEMAQAQGQQIGQGHGAEGSPAGEEQMQNPNGGGMPDTENPAGSELDQHIEKLESMLKSEKLDPKDASALVGKISDLRKSMKQEAELKKSAAAISAIARALHKPAFKIGQNASHNMNNSAKAAVTMQHKIVTDIMKSWDVEESAANNSIKKILDIEGLNKKE